ncbi:MAG: hypothetical protein A2667_01325, partial [Candidatus Wildermuthbacteria bacterium RIFCSPHIGHO2_01_FULL_47_27]
LILILAAGLGIFTRQIIGQKSISVKESSIREEAVPETETAQWEQRVNNEGNVEVAVTPKDLSPGAASWDFEISLNTHSVELDYVMEEIAVLTDETGKEYRSVMWEGAESGGHHRSGVLKFNPISPRPKSVTLILRGIGGIAERRFTWMPEKTPQEMMMVSGFFNNDKMDPEFSCNKVFAVERIIPKTQAMARAALEELFKGPTEEEKAQGFLTSMPPGVQIQRLSIENGTAKADFNDALEYQVGGSCRVSAIRAQITETLKQFPTVQQVVISIDGRTEDILQP